MRIYRGKSLIGSDASYSEFAHHFGGAILEGSDDPFLLVRDDGPRMEVIAADGMLMLCIARSSRDCQVSFGPTYVDAKKQFRGLSSTREAKEENFIEASFAMQAIEAFFHNRRMSEFADFRSGRPDPEILDFPEPIADELRVERRRVERQIEIPTEFRDDMKAVCEFLDEVADDPDVNIDFDDAIQIGSLCGGRIDSRTGTYLFSYHLRSRDVWMFKTTRGVLDGIADGVITKLSVDAYETK